MINEPKPKPCVGCGYCCMKTPCDAARRLYPTADKCPQLLWEERENRYKCGLMLIGGIVGEGYRKELYANEGCCSSLNTWRKDVKKRDQLDMNKNWNPLDSIFQIFLNSFSRQLVSSDVLALTIMGMQQHLQDKGFSDDEISHINKTITHFFNQGRRSFNQKFMG